MRSTGKLLSKLRPKRLQKVTGYVHPKDFETVCKAPLDLLQVTGTLSWGCEERPHFAQLQTDEDGTTVYFEIWSYL